MTTPREPDRYTNAEWQRAARILDACLNGSHEHDEGGLVLAAESWRPIAAALRAAESSALERAARIARRYSHHAEREIRALIPPAAPAAETGKCGDRTDCDAAQARIAELETAIRWALGEEGEFRTREPGEGAFWWRIELRRRAGGSK